MWWNNAWCGVFLAITFLASLQSSVYAADPASGLPYYDYELEADETIQTPYQYSASTGFPMDSYDRKCPCKLTSECQRPYGMSVYDIRDFGSIPPCAKRSMVRCCGEPVSDVNTKSNEDDRMTVSEVDAFDYPDANYAAVQPADQSLDNGGDIAVYYMSSDDNGSHIFGNDPVSQPDVASADLPMEHRGAEETFEAATTAIRTTPAPVTEKVYQTFTAYSPYSIKSASKENRYSGYSKDNYYPIVETAPSVQAQGEKILGYGEAKESVMEAVPQDSVPVFTPKVKEQQLKQVPTTAAPTTQAPYAEVEVAVQGHDDTRPAYSHETKPKVQFPNMKVKFVDNVVASPGTNNYNLPMQPAVHKARVETGQTSTAKRPARPVYKAAEVTSTTQPPVRVITTTQTPERVTTPTQTPMQVVSKEVEPLTVKYSNYQAQKQSYDQVIDSSLGKMPVQEVFAAQQPVNPENNRTEKQNPTKDTAPTFAEPLVPEVTSDQSAKQHYSNNWQSYPAGTYQHEFADQQQQSKPQTTGDQPAEQQYGNNWQSYPADAHQHDFANHQQQSQPLVADGERAEQQNNNNLQSYPAAAYYPEPLYRQQPVQQQPINPAIENPSVTSQNNFLFSQQQSTGVFSAPPYFYYTPKPVENQQVIPSKVPDSMLVKEAVQNAENVREAFQKVTGVQKVYKAVSGIHEAVQADIEGRRAEMTYQKSIADVEAQRATIAYHKAISDQPTESAQVQAPLPRRQPATFVTYGNDNQVPTVPLPTSAVSMPEQVEVPNMTFQTPHSPPSYRGLIFSPAQHTYTKESPIVQAVSHDLPQASTANMHYAETQGGANHNLEYPKAAQSYVPVNQASAPMYQAGSQQYIAQTFHRNTDTQQSVEPEPTVVYHSAVGHQGSATDSAYGENKTVTMYYTGSKNFDVNFKKLEELSYTKPSDVRQEVRPYYTKKEKYNEKVAVETTTTNPIEVHTTLEPVKSTEGASTVGYAQTTEKPFVETTTTTEAVTTTEETTTQAPATTTVIATVFTTESQASKISQSIVENLPVPAKLSAGLAPKYKSIHQAAVLKKMNQHSSGASNSASKPPSVNNPPAAHFQPSQFAATNVAAKPNIPTDSLKEVQPVRAIYNQPTSRFVGASIPSAAQVQPVATLQPFSPSAVYQPSVQAAAAQQFQPAIVYQPRVPATRQYQSATVHQPSVQTPVTQQYQAAAAYQPSVQTAASQQYQVYQAPMNNNADQPRAPVAVYMPPSNPSVSALFPPVQQRPAVPLNFAAPHQSQGMRQKLPGPLMKVPVPAPAHMQPVGSRPAAIQANPVHQQQPSYHSYRPSAQPVAAATYAAPVGRPVPMQPVALQIPIMSVDEDKDDKKSLLGPLSLGKDMLGVGKGLLAAGTKKMHDQVEATKDMIHGSLESGKDMMHATMETGKDMIHGTIESGKDMLHSGKEMLHDGLHAGKATLDSIIPSVFKEDKHPQQPQVMLAQPVMYQLPVRPQSYPAMQRPYMAPPTYQRSPPRY